MKAAVVVPARFASTRHPGKPLVPLRGATGASKPLIRRSWEAAAAAVGADQVVVATDDARIADAARGFGARVAMTPADCRNGTERCAAALPGLGDVDAVVNLQGDAPLTPPIVVRRLLDALRDEPDALVVTPAVRAAGPVHRRLLADQAAGRVGGTTVVADRTGRALYFSKAVIPHVPADRAGDPDLPVLLHLGVYGYRRAALERYAAAPPSPLEELEGLEQLRFLDQGVPVRVLEVDLEGMEMWELNNPSDVEPIEAALRARGID